MDFESETFVCGTLNANGKASGSATQQDAESGLIIPILEAGARTGTSTDDPRAGIGIGEDGDPMFTLQSGKQHAVGVIPIDMRQCSRGATMTNNRPYGCSGGAPGTGIGEEGDPSPTIAASHTPAVAFKAAYFTRGKDGAPSEISPPLSADADKGDQDTLVFDTTNLTSKANRSNPQPGDPRHPLSQSAHPPAIAFRAAGQERFTPSEIAPPLCNTDGGGTIPTIAFSAKDSGGDAQDDLSPTLRSGNHDKSHANAGVMPAIAFNLRGREGGAMPEVAESASLRSASGGSSRSYIAGMAVRRLTPTECERLQGFWDSFTAINYRGKPAADGPRYRALGNSMAVPVLAWLGDRIRKVMEQS